MSHIDAEEALKIYRRFCKQAERLDEYLSVANKLQNLINVPIPSLKLVRQPLAFSWILYHAVDDPVMDRRLFH
jgi:phosphatidylinositol-binding clathrin assembly protein